MLKDKDIIIIKFNTNQTYLIKYGKLIKIKYFENLMQFNDQKLIKCDYNSEDRNYYEYNNETELSYDMFKILNKYAQKRIFKNISLENIEQVILYLDMFLIKFNPLDFDLQLLVSYLDILTNIHIIEILFKNQEFLDVYYCYLEKYYPLFTDKTFFKNLNINAFIDEKYNKFINLNFKTTYLKIKVDDNKHILIIKIKKYKEDYFDIEKNISMYIYKYCSTNFVVGFIRTFVKNNIEKVYYIDNNANLIECNHKILTNKSCGETTKYAEYDPIVAYEHCDNKYFYIITNN